MLPGLIQDFYLVGSLALGGFRPGRSDIDFIATLNGRLSPRSLRALRAVHRNSYVGGLAHAAFSRSWPLVCNGVFVSREDLTRPPREVAAQAKQVAGKFGPGDAFDVNPVTWWTLAHAGIPLRGPAPALVSIPLDDGELRQWTAFNLNSYWRPWAHRVAGSGPRGWPERLRQLHARRLAAWGVLGTARMHATIRTGKVITKECAGDYALKVFGAEWHPVIHDALAYWRGLPSSRPTSRDQLRSETAAFVLHVVALVGAPETEDTAPAGNWTGATLTTEQRGGGVST